MGEMRVLSARGDIVIEWDPHTPDSVEEAKEQWAEMKKLGYEFFEALPGEKGKRIKRFKPDLARVLVIPGVKSAEDKKKRTRPKAMAGGPLGGPVRAR